ncbi:MAG: NAD(P)/FAD-dependent oxidoreductase [Proteobacteria bacterium]|nr:NAD(P)/FAD-dependent oxidoreductase [Pseudomonadota bacterium]
MTHSVAIIGAGPMGLMCAYRLLKEGHKVEIFEQDDRIGGMSASFDFEGTEIERYYHFICKGDRPLFDSLKELGIEHALKWRNTRMGFFYHGRLYGWGNPLYLLRFNAVSLFARARYAIHIFYCQHVKNYRILDRMNATLWLQKWLGKKAYAVFWEPLLRLKYFEYADNISAAWVAARIRRVAESRKSIWQEELGYLEGGSATFLNRLASAINDRGGVIHLSTPVHTLHFEKGVFRAVGTEKGQIVFDAVASTVAMPLLDKIAPDMPASERAKIGAISNIAVVCVVVKLTEAFTGNFWTNIHHPDVAIPGIVEYSNLVPMPEHILYVPYYMPPTHPKYRYTDEQFLEEVVKYLSILKPGFTRKGIKAVKVNRCRYAQTVCTPGFYDALPSMESSVAGFYKADTAFYYPEDRSISESIQTATILAKKVHDYLMRKV